MKAGFTKLCFGMFFWIWLHASIQLDGDISYVLFFFPLLFGTVEV